MMVSLGNGQKRRTFDWNGHLVSNRYSFIDNDSMRRSCSSWKNEGKHGL